MKLGDLVQMKYTVWWRTIRIPAHLRYTESYGVLLESDGSVIKVLMKDGQIKTGLFSEWEPIASEGKPN